MLNAIAALLLTIPAACFAAPSPSALQISLDTGTFQGVANEFGIEKWLGIRYAEAPEGPLRFKAPVPITRHARHIQNASEFGNACPQPFAPILNAPIAEDCLFLNVFRPPNTEEDAKLPILVWLHGGAFMMGASSRPDYDPTRIIRRSMTINKPIIFISLNYRVNTFGFLASADVPPEDLNSGFQDQRVALKWIKDNISKFGGDPDKVTIWGQSAGAGSVQAHYIYPPSEPLFRAGISDSSTGPFKNSPPASLYDRADQPYARLLAATGCAAGPTSFACLQDVPFETLMNISNAMVVASLNRQLWQPAIGPIGSVFPVRASQRMIEGDFLDMPFISGTLVNEGNQFSTTLKGLNLVGDDEDAAFADFIKNVFIDNTTISANTIARLLELYPSGDPIEGAPHHTGDSLFDRAEAWNTDSMFLAPQRLWIESAAKKQPTFVYYFTEFIPGTDPARGVYHEEELAFIFDGLIPADEVSTEAGLHDQFTDFYLNFVNDLNPGSEWPAFTLESREVLQIERGNITVIKDDRAREKTDFMNSPQVLTEFQK